MATNQSKERILAAAKELFLARGYSATTVDAICEKVELTKGSVYYFFDSKEDLGLAVLDWSMRRGTQMLANGPHVRVVDPVEKAFAFLKHLEKCAPEIWSGGCLLGFVLARACRYEFPHAASRCGHVPGARGRLRGETSTHRGSVRREARSAASELADTLLSTVEGSIILAKAHRDPTRIPKAIRGFRLSVATLIAEPA